MADCSVQEMNSWASHGLCFQSSCSGVYNISSPGVLKCKRVSFVGLEECNVEKSKDSFEGYNNSYSSNNNNNNNNNNNDDDDDDDDDDGWVNMDSMDCNGGGPIPNKGPKDRDIDAKLVSKGYEKAAPRMIKRSIDECLQQPSSKQESSSSSLYSDDDEENEDGMGSLIPGLPDDIAKACMALIPRSELPAMGHVSKAWKSLIESREFHKLRKDSHMVEEWLYALTVSDNDDDDDSDGDAKEMCWRVFNPGKNEWRGVAPMPGPVKTGSGLAVIDGKLLVIGGAVGNGGGAVADVLIYDSALDRWKRAASMRRARHEFACAVLDDGRVYVVGGRGEGGKNLAEAEVYDPSANAWEELPGLRRPRWGCIGAGIGGKLYVMGGRSSFTIGHSRCVDVFDPATHLWIDDKEKKKSNSNNNGCTMVLAHAVLGHELFCIEWKHEHKLAGFSGDAWRRVGLPLAGSLSVAGGFCLAGLAGKLLLYPTRADAPCGSFLFDPSAPPGAASEWQPADLPRSIGTCLFCATIAA